ncbi:S8 family serine peptidase [Yinghuangia soli]|uniref:S8 family serine peptidase n=1 Tax=Yinghuangia soli TaxID=2908204 RepID=A0AA41PUT7_9ACTN|nr:S8 family serine peptidase [Yinghuangia soli]MCF2526268.1 S8 family serine peptidase [Yinghuangia soli]
MRISGRTKAAGAAAGFLALLAAPLPALAADPAPPGAPDPAVVSSLGVLSGDRPAADPVRDATVTLITGDKVTVRTVGGRRTAQVAPGPGRQDVAFTVVDDERGIAVLPADAVAAVAAGKIAPGFFDVTQLIAWGYDDASTAVLPVLARRPAGVAADAAPPRGMAKSRSFARIDTDALTVDKSQAARTWQELVGAEPPARQRDPRAPLGGGKAAKLWPDGKAELQDAAIDKLVNAAPAAAAGYTGAGAVVAVLDTGYDPTHPDLQGVVIAAKDFTGAGIVDTNGHGTHVSTIIAGSGAASGGRHKGIAPGAKLVQGRICNSGCPQSAILAGIEWAVQTQGAHIVNLSIGGPAQKDDPIVSAINSYALFAGTLFVVAAGNDGPSARTVTSPGTAAAALTVGAGRGGDGIASFSGRGPTKFDNLAKPDLVTPGTNTVAGRAAGTGMGIPVDQYYTSANGTSMATPVAAGAAALIKQQHPSWASLYIKGALTASARPMPGLTVFEQGAGHLDIGAALQRDIVPYLVGQVNVPAPHPAGQSVQNGTTLFNGGTSAAALNFGVQAYTEQGTAAPAGLVAMTAAQATLAAGAAYKADVTVRGDLAPPGTYVAVVTATDTAGKVRSVFPVSVHIAPAKHRLTLTALDRNGQPASGTVLLHSGRNNLYRNFTLVDGALDCTPDAAGADPCMLDGFDYLARAVLTAKDAGGATTAFDFAFRTVSMGAGPVAWTVDARQMKPMGVTVDTAGAAIESQTVVARHPSFGEVLWFGGRGSTTSATGGLHTNRVMPVAAPGLTYLNRTTWTNGTASSPYRYEVLDARENGVPSVPGVAATKAGSAHLAGRYKAQGVAPSGGGMLGHDAAYKGVPMRISFPTPVTVPYRVDEYLTAAPDISWGTLFSIQAAGGEPNTMLDRNFQSYSPGSSTSQVRGAAVVGPVLPQTVGTRIGDVLTFGQPGRHADDFWRTGAVDFFGDSWGGGKTLSPVDASSKVTVRAGTQQLAVQPWTQGAGMQVALPPGTSTVTVDADISRTTAYSTLSPRVRATWTFGTSTTPGTQAAALPIMAPRTICGADTLDDYNRVKTGTPLMCLVPFETQPGFGNGYVSLATAKAEMSTNDGQTWTQVAGFGPNNQVLNVPGVAAPGYVSLRISGTDAAGNSAVVTVIRAYQVIA